MHGTGSTLTRKRCSLCSTLVAGLWEGLCLSCQAQMPLLGDPRESVGQGDGLAAVARVDAPVLVVAQAAACTRPHAHPAYAELAAL